MKTLLGTIAILTAVLLLGGCQSAPESAPPAETATPEPAPPAEPEVKEDPTPDAVVATGAFMGRSGKPMAGAKLVLGTIEGDTMYPDTLVKLAQDIDTITVDKEGKFEFKGFEPGKYTVLYLPRGGGSLFPNELRVKVLGGTMDSIAPLLIDAELGKTRPLKQRKWGRHFILLKGHTLYSKGAKMNAWNATVKVNPRGPYLELRRSRIWSQDLEDNSEIELEAWGY